MSATHPGKSFDGTVEMTTHFAPAVTPGGGQKRGILHLVDANTNEPFALDIWDLKAQGRCGTVMGVLGKRGHGKTATNIFIAKRMRMRRAGRRSKRRLSVSINDHRRNNARPEYLKFCQYIGVEEIPLAHYQLNILDPELKLTTAERLEMLVNSFEYELKRPLTTDEVKALRYGLKMLYEWFPAEANMGLLMFCLRRLNNQGDIGNVQQYQGGVELQQSRNYLHDEDFRQRLAQLDGLKPRYSPRLLDAAIELADAIENMLDGEYGEMFGGKHSLADIMQVHRGMAAFDFSELSDDALTQILSVMWRVKTSAMRRGDHNLYYDIEIHDENYELWKNLVYARAMHKFLKQVRSTSTFVILSTHRLRDYETVGPEGSEQYKLATNMIDDIDLWLLGRHTRRAAEDTARHLDLTDEEKELLLGLNPGTWGLKIGSEPMRLVRVDLTPVETELTASDDANDELAIDAFRKLLEETEYVPFEDDEEDEEVELAPA